MTNRETKCFYLYVGEEGAILLPHTTPPNPEAALYAHSLSDDDALPLLERMLKEPKAEIIILADTQTQTIRLDELPPLSFFDRKKLLARRLDAVFPDANYTTYIKHLDGDPLLIGLESKGAVDLWLDRLSQLPNDSGVIFLLPVESAKMPSKFAANMREGWSIFLSHHPSSGFRQIVMRDGDVLFTRLTPPLPNSTSAGLAAINIALDIEALRTYLSRFGLSSKAPVQLIALVPPFLCKALRATPLNVATRLILTPHEAAQRLGLPTAISPEEQNGELVHLLWLSIQKRLRAPLMTPNIRQKRHEKQLDRISSGTSLFITLLILLYIIISGFRLFNQYRDNEMVRNQIDSLNKQMEIAQTDLAFQTEPLYKLRKATERQRLFTHTEPAFFSVLPAFATSLEHEGRLEQLVWDNRTLTLQFYLFKKPDQDTPDEQRLQTIVKNMTHSLSGYQIRLEKTTMTHSTKSEAEPPRKTGRITIQFPPDATGGEP